MIRENLTLLLDNDVMLNESLIKSGLVTFTGNLRYKRVKSTDSRATVNYSYVVEFEVIVDEKKEFKMLFTARNTLKEFTNLGSLESYLKKINFLKDDDYPDLEGTILCSFEKNKKT